MEDNLIDQGRVPERARFADTHAAVGILPGGGMTARLPRAVGFRMAMEMSYTGRLTRKRRER